MFHLISFTVWEIDIIDHNWLCRISNLKFLTKFNEIIKKTREKNKLNNYWFISKKFKYKCFLNKT
jgi:hypothetical protein